MKGLQKALILSILSLLLLLSGAGLGFASTYEQSVKAYRSEKYKDAVKIAIRVAQKSSDTERARAYVIAGAAAIEIGKKDLARRYFERALKADSEALLPSFVRSNKKVRRLFSKVKDQDSGSFFSGLLTKPDESRDSAFDDYATYLPLGINQILQGKIFLGSTVGTLQAFAVFSTFKNLSDASTLEKDLAKVTEAAIEVGDEKSPKYLDFEKDSQTYIQQKRTSAYLSLVGAAVLYGASVYEAGFYPPRASKSKKAALLPDEGVGPELGWEWSDLLRSRYTLTLSMSL